MWKCEYIQIPAWVARIDIHIIAWAMATNKENDNFPMDLKTIAMASHSHIPHDNIANVWSLRLYLVLFSFHNSLLYLTILYVVHFIIYVVI